MLEKFVSSFPAILHCTNFVTYWAEVNFFSKIENNLIQMASNHLLRVEESIPRKIKCF